GYIVANLEAAESLDLALGAASPDRIRSPDDLVLHTHIQELAEQVHGNFGPGAGCRIPGRSELEKDILEMVALDDVHELGDPGNVLRIIFSALFALRRRMERGVVNDEIQIGEIPGGLFDIARMAMLFVE